MVAPPDSMALLRLATRATKEIKPLVKGAKDIRNMVSKHRGDLKFKDITHIRQGKESTYYYSCNFL